LAKLKFNKKERQILPTSKWQVLIVDDDKEIHEITKTVLEKIVFDNRSLNFHHAFNEKEAIDIMKNNNNICFMLLDVVMDTNIAGLNVVKAVREDLKNDLVRIILRTGQPGTAPEKDIILNYDINDYKEKTELTSTKLYTTVITALRSYKTLKRMVNANLYLEQLVDSNKSIYEEQFFSNIVPKIVKEISNILNINKNLNQDIMFIAHHQNKFKLINSFLLTEYNLSLENIFLKTVELKKNLQEDNDYVFYLDIEGYIYLIYISDYIKLSDIQKNILFIFISNITVALKNLFLHNKIIENLDNQKKDLEIKINQAVHDVKSKDKLIQNQSRLVQIGEMISMIAHQWRQPLNAIAANVMVIETKMSFIKNEANINIDLYSFLEKKLASIEKYVQSLSLTIDNFRNFYKLDNIKSISTINECVNNVLSILESTMKAKGISLIYEYNSFNELELFVNEFMQVIFHIIKNSQEKFESNIIANPMINIFTYDIQNGVRLEIFDNGACISDDILDSIFDPYFSTKIEKNGTGLGLYMSKLIVEEHHSGKLSCENMKNGVKFILDIYF